MTTEIADAWCELIVCCGIGFLIVSGAICLIISTVSNYGDDIVKLIKEMRSDKSEDDVDEK